MLVLFNLKRFYECLRTQRSFLLGASNPFNCSLILFVHVFCFLNNNICSLDLFKIIIIIRADVAALKF
jgi:hypothetical protein